MRTPAAAEKVWKETVLWPAKLVNERLIFIVSAHHTDVFLNAPEWPYAKAFAESRHGSLSLCCLWNSCVVVLIVCARTELDASAFSIETVDQVCTLHVLHEWISSDWPIWGDQFKSKHYPRSPECPQHLRDSIHGDETFLCRFPGSRFGTLKNSPDLILVLKRILWCNNYPDLGIWASGRDLWGRILARQVPVENRGGIVSKPDGKHLLRDKWMFACFRSLEMPASSRPLFERFLRRSSIS